MARGYTCPECGNYTGRYRQGAYHCSTKACGAVWWTAFDKPSAGTSRKGSRYQTCGNQTMHPVTSVADAFLYRCSTCATTLLIPS